jgi:antibiotic biosynthesis monooxygenase (ABM) superfamily enzyme
MGFYYNPGTPDGDESPGGWKETLLIIWTVFRVLALPLALLFGALFGLIALFFIFSFSTVLGFAIIGAGILALIGRGIWEARHPPEFP